MRGEICRHCHFRIRVMIFRGTGYCCTHCFKALTRKNAKLSDPPATVDP
jgi:hypothetical protein